MYNPLTYSPPLPRPADIAEHTVDVDDLEAERARLRSAPAEAPVVYTYDEVRLAHLRARQDFAMERVRETGAVIEVCPTSNRRIGGFSDPAAHPVHRFMAAGLRLVVASDDPGIFDMRLADEIRWVAEAVGLDDAGVAALSRGAWDFRSEVLSGRLEAIEASARADGDSG